MSWKSSAIVTEDDIVYETPTHWVLRCEKGFEVYRTGATCSVRCATIGFEGTRGKLRAIKECDRRHRDVTGNPRKYACESYYNSPVAANLEDEFEGDDYQGREHGDVA